MEDWVFKIADHFGPSAAFLTVIGLGAWRLCVFSKPLVLAAFEKHFALIDSMISKVQSIDTIQKIAADCVIWHSETHKRIDLVLHKLDGKGGSSPDTKD